MLALGLLGGLGLGLAAALVSDHLDKSIRHASELGRQFGELGISTVPKLQRGHGLSIGRLGGGAAQERIEAAQFSDLLAALTDVKNEDAGHYRQSVLRLLAKIKSAQRPGRPHTVLLTAPTARSGNSATSLALAYAAASAGERVLLVDSTSSNPELSRIFASSVKPEGTVVLDNKEHLAKITTRDARSGLAFLPIALADLRTLKNVQRRRLIAGLTGLSQDYDLVFIDAGAILSDEAAACLLPSADQVLVVARSGQTTQKQIAETLEVLDSARGKITGAVLTMVD